MAPDAGYTGVDPGKCWQFYGGTTTGGTPIRQWTAEGRPLPIWSV